MSNADQQRGAREGRRSHADIVHDVETVRALGQYLRRCVRHGDHGTVTTRVKVPNKPPPLRWRDLLFTSTVLTILVRGFQVLEDKKVIEVTEWPMCPRCERRRRGFRTAVWFLPVLGPVTMVAPFLVMIFFGVDTGPLTDETVWALAFVIGLVLTFLTAPCFAASRPAAVAKLASNREATVLRIRRPSPRFVADFEACVRGEVGDTGSFASPVVDLFGDPSPAGGR